MKDIGAAIRARRKALILGQAALAQKVGVSREWIIDIEKGKPRAEAALLLRTLDTLGLAIELDVEPESLKPSGLAPTRLQARARTDVNIDEILDRARGRKR
jgi:HTH-type transcriptional regulator/antitoxin HipB